MKNKYFLLLITLFYIINICASQEPITVMVVFKRPIPCSELSKPYNAYHRKKSMFMKEVCGADVLDEYAQRYTAWDISATSEDTFYWVRCAKFSTVTQMRSALGKVTYDNWCKAEDAVPVPVRFLLANEEDEIVAEAVIFKSEQVICNNKIKELPIIGIDDAKNIFIPSSIIQRLTELSEGLMAEVIISLPTMGTRDSELFCAPKELVDKCNANGITCEYNTPFLQLTESLGDSLGVKVSVSQLQELLERF